MKALLGGLSKLAGRVGRQVNLMEVCGTHTVSVFRHGIRDVIPGEIRLLSGPGCPVCVTPLRDVDTAIAMAEIEGVILATFGDMMRVPGGKRSFDEARAEGADIRVVYSPMDALEMAERNPEHTVVFFATGFETTSPLVAATLSEALRRGVRNFRVQTAHKLVPPALRALLDSPEVRVDGFILPGHVSAIIGSRPYGFIAGDYGIPGVITGFGAKDIIEGITMLLGQMARGRAGVEIQYSKVVREEGNPKAVSMIHEYFEPFDAHWRGLGTIPQSGLRLREAHGEFDALRRFSPEVPDYPEPTACACGEVLKGVKSPADCRLFGTSCTPERPKGACMVSTEGSCSAYYRYGRHDGR